MQKQRIVEYVEDNVHEFPAPSARSAPAPTLRLAREDDVSVLGPARRLQNDLAKAFTPGAAWSVKRTVIAGAVFHAVVLGSLAVAASNLFQPLTH